MPPWVPERIREAMPDGSELRVMEVEADGSGDGVARVHPEVLTAVEDADAYFGYGIPEELLRVGDELRWVHSAAAGVGGSLTPTMLERDVLFTNSAGIHAEPMADHVLAMILHFARGLDVAVRFQAEGRWETGPFYAADAPVSELPTWTVGVVGFGGVGRAVARRCAALGARVLGLRRTAPDQPVVELEGPHGRTVGTAEVLAGPGGYRRLLEESDVVVVSAPETDETRGMVDAEALSRMKEDALLVNVARGGLVEQDALVEALEAGRLRGAALDVTDPEPLPEGHPLWRMDNVLITPHVSGVTHRFWERQTALIAENIERFEAGRPLRNLVDKRAGY